MASSFRIVAAALLPVALLIAPAGAQLLPARNHPVAFWVADVEAGDLNGDGLTDVVAGTLASGGGADGTVSVLLRDPAGGLLPFAPFGVDGHASDVELGDLNGDAILDFVSANPNGDSISVRLGAGTGAFGPLHVLEGIDSPSRITLADFDQDGDDDVAAIQLVADTLTILLSDGTGALIAAGTYPVADLPQDIARADFDGNGTADLAIVTHFSNWSVLLGDGSGGFTAGISEPLPGQGSRILAGDIDEDGDADTLTQSPGGILLHLGNGDGTFATLPLDTSGVHSLQLADVDGNGYDDLIGVSATLHGVRVLLGGAGPGFAAPLPEIPLDPNYGRLAVVEVDGDGLLDIVVGSTISTGVAVLKGKGFGVFESYGRLPFNKDPADYALADFDGDDDVDAAIASLGYFGGDGGTVVMLNDGTGALAQSSFFALGQIMDVAAGDVDDDGDADIVSLSQIQGLEIQLGNGTGSFPPPFLVSPGPQAHGLTLGDVDADGDADAIVCRSFGASAAISVLLADGFGSFWKPVSFLVGGAAIDPTLADLDLDGDVDLLAVLKGSDSIAILLGDGSGLFAPPTFLHVPNEPSAVAVSDVSGDGLPDLVVTHSLGVPQTGSVTVHAADGAGGFLPPQAFEASYALESLAIADLDADGVDDLVSVEGFQAGRAIVLLGDGAGGFLPPRRHVGGESPGHVATTDIDGDGRTDVLVLDHHTDFETGSINVLRNLGVPEPWTALGKGLKGSVGIPMLVGHGSLQAGEPASLTLHGARRASATILVIGFSPLYAPLKGGVLVPRPNILLGGLLTNAAGALDLHGNWPAGVPPDLPTWYQLWIVDPGAIQGVAASNAVKAITP